MREVSSKRPLVYNTECQARNQLVHFKSLWYDTAANSSTLPSVVCFNMKVEISYNIHLGEMNLEWYVWLEHFPFLGNQNVYRATQCWNDLQYLPNGQLAIALGFLITATITRASIKEICTSLMPVCMNFFYKF